MLDGLEPLFGIEPINALPSLWFSDAALMLLVGVEAPQVRQGICQRGPPNARRSGFLARFTLIP